MNVAIIVEGPDDFETYPVFIRKIRQDISRIFPVQCNGLRRLKTTFVPFLKDFQQRRDRAVRKALVIRDSDCANPRPLEEQLQRIFEQSRVQLDFPVHFYATKCKLESWLLADEEAISHVSLSRGGRGRVERISIALERYNDADTLLAGALWQADLQATSRVYAEIAEAACADRIAQRCPYFREFVAKVSAC